MSARDITQLIALAAIWGSSFLFMKMGAGEFGPVALAFARVAGATLLLLPLLIARREAHILRTHWRPIFVVGIASSALPFLCFAYAALAINAGLSAIFNATVPLFGAVMAALWLKERLTGARIAGLAIGFAGVAWLAWDKASFKPGSESTGLAVLACIAATLSYAFAANYTKRRLSGLPSLALAAGSQLASAIVLAIPAALFWPARMPGAPAWTATLLLALLCTGLAYIMYFRLIANVGPTNAVTVTFLVPIFGVLWGALFLGERVTADMALGCAVIIAGTTLSTGYWQPAWLGRRAAE